MRRNRRFWDRQSAEYDRRFAPVLGGRSAMAWGLWRLPESSLHLLDPVRGRVVLELGCGAARWSAALARRGARSVGLDLSEAQLRAARAVTRRARAPVRLLRASAERLPFRAGSVDQVFCDWGALTFADPRRTIPEVARVLRPGGALVFAAASPFRYLAFDRRRDAQVARLTRPYFGMHRLEFGDSTEFQLPYSGWITLFRDAGLEVERLIETRPSGRARSRYLSLRDNGWGRRWPMECLWKLRKEVRPRPPGVPRARPARSRR